MTDGARPRVAWPVFGLLALALLPMSASLANGFAWDDAFIIESNPLVQSGDVVGALTSPYWPDAFTFAGSGLYRPITSAAFALQWTVFGGSPLGFHLVALLAHAAVTLLIYGLLRGPVGGAAAFAGAAVFAAHPVHVEAVANVVGQAELWTALFTLLGIGAWRAWDRADRSAVRVALCLLVGASYALALGSKEIGVAMPALALLLLWSEGRALRRSAPLVALSAAVLLCYLGIRLDVVGTLRGEVPAPELMGLSTVDRVLTGLSVWVDYARLSILPASLSADYGPAVRFPARGVDPLVIAGAMTLAALAAVAVAQRKSRPLVSAGLAWFAVAVLPVSNLLLPSGVLLAERTLYLPSVGLALLVAGFVSTRRVAPRRALVVGLTVAVVLFAARSAQRVPTWKSTEAVLASLAADQPDSHIVQRQTALRAMSEGDGATARESFGRALALTPNHFSLLTEVAQFEAVSGNREAAVHFAGRAIEVYPTSPHGYAVLARVLRLSGDPDAAERAAANALRLAEPLGPIWRELERAREAQASDD